MAEVRQAAAIVLGVDTQIGLALVRELGRAGIPVVAISHDPNAIGLHSRYVREALVVGPPRSDAWVDAINRSGAAFGRASLLTVSEANLAWVNRIRDRLLPCICPAVPRQEVLLGVLDKSRTLAAAMAVGVDVPRTAEPSSMQAWNDLAETFPYPAVLKWPDPNAISPRLSGLGIELLKAEYVLDADSMRKVGERYARVGAWPMVQEYCPGRGLGQFFFMDQSMAVRRFQHVRIAEWPPEGGFSAVCDSVPLSQHAELQEKSIRLLQALDWQGVAMVEYRQDPASGRCVLMEVNGRFWGSLPLAVACGAGFGLLAHAAALGQSLPAMPPPRAGLRCRMLAAETRRLVRVLWQPRRIRDPFFARTPLRDLLRFLVDFVRPGVRYFVATRDDLGPLWRDFRNLLPKRSA